MASRLGIHSKDAKFLADLYDPLIDTQSALMSAWNYDATQKDKPETRRSIEMIVTQEDVTSTFRLTLPLIRKNVDEGTKTQRLFFKAIEESLQELYGPVTTNYGRKDFIFIQFEADQSSSIPKMQKTIDEKVKDYKPSQYKNVPVEVTYLQK